MILTSPRGTIEAAATDYTLREIAVGCVTLDLDSAESEKQVVEVWG